MRRIVGTITAAIVLGSAFQAHAQQADRRAAMPSQPPAPAPRPRIGYAASPAPVPQPQLPVVIVQQDGFFVPTGFIITGAPFVVLTDGSVAVNFGNGYERVLRPCAALVNQAVVDPNARDPFGRIPDPPGIAALRAGTRGQIGGTMPALNTAACYRTNAQGQPVVVSAR